MRALEHALTIVKVFATASHQGYHAQHDENEHRDASIVDNIPPELHYMTIHGSSKMEAQGLVWADHLSSQTMERMSLAIMSNTVYGEMALQYKLCLFSKATTFISRWLRVCPSDQMSEYLDKSRKVYSAATLECLRRIDFTRSPNLAMLQALLAGAAVVQLHGDTTRSWFLVSLASRSIVALSYHKMTSFDSDSDEENEIRRCIYYCYYMDKTLSMLLLRPPSLPQLPFNPADLVPTDPQLPISMHVKILVKLARVQDVALSLVLKDPRHQILANKEFMLENIQTELKSIGDEIQQSRYPPHREPSIMIEWDTVDFTFFSIATTVLRLDSSSLQDKTRREECLRYARKALHSMQACQKHICSKSSITPDYLFWTVLLYPLTPFFVIFCNVVATSNMDDLRLLKEVTVTISRLKEQYIIGMNLHRLLSELIGLCAELHDIPSSGDPRRSQEGRSSCNRATHIQMLSNGGDFETGVDIADQTASLPTPGQDEMPPDGLPSLPESQSVCHELGDPATRSASIWDDGLMFELFNLQPSVEWLDIEGVDMIHGLQN
ncbi:hypothetical protein N7533_006677 [Penicillium manginii]|uniref:uncharacterized protein n=1 Tax=Penicillium manginii TaxID=203109 RepID=UPI00254886A6|nr:uncharacterized protein N7533_006677 [Penicillium manginii]KAJ5749649.1 hypothetical protein N7533_006677 [Penicillium manginii]